MRSEDDQSLRALDSIFRTTLPKGLKEYNESLKTGPPLTLHLDQIGFRPSGSTSEDSPLVQRSKASLEAFGITPRLGIMSGNANWLMHRGIPAVTQGWGGKSDQAHSLDEWWLDDNGTLAIKLALLTLVAEAGLQE